MKGKGRDNTGKGMREKKRVKREDRVEKKKKEWTQDQNEVKNKGNE